MSARILSSELIACIGKEVFIQGWLDKKITKGKKSYILVRDRKGLIRINIDNQKTKDILQVLSHGTILSVKGVVFEISKKSHQVELRESQITIDVLVTENKSDSSEKRILAFRNTTTQGVWKIQSGITDVIRQYLKSQDFTEFHSPKLFFPTLNSLPDIFTLDFYGTTLGLAQTDQFYKQIAAGGLERVFEIGPTFRKERISSRHLAEFTTIDVEMAFINNFSDILTLIENLITTISEEIWKNYKEELKLLKAKKVVIPARIPSISLKQAHTIFSEKTRKEMNIESDLTIEEELLISTYAKNKWKSDAIFIAEFPVSTMKFYDYKSEINPNTVERADLILRGVEVLTVRRRENRYEHLVSQLKQSGGNLNEPLYQYYLQNFKYGMPNHAGFGLGLERLTAQLIGLKNIKEATLFPRDADNIIP